MRAYWAYFLLGLPVIVAYSLIPRWGEYTLGVGGDIRERLRVHDVRARHCQAELSPLLTAAGRAGPAFGFRIYGFRAAMSLGSHSTSRRRIRSLARRHGGKQTQCHPTRKPSGVLFQSVPYSPKPRELSNPSERITDINSHCDKGYLHKRASNILIWLKHATSNKCGDEPRHKPDH